MKYFSVKQLIALFLCVGTISIMCANHNEVNLYSNSHGNNELSNNQTYLSGKSLKIRVYLQGALENAGNQYSSDGRILMRDNLRVSPFNGSNFIPNTDPYQTKVKLVDLSKTNKHVALGALPEYTTITNPEQVFGVTGENAIVDWVFVEIRLASDNKKVMATRSGLLQRDGDIVDVDGVSDLYFPTLNDAEFFVVVRHRNHLGVMSNLVTGSQVIDFTNPQTSVFEYRTTLNPKYNYTGISRYINTNYNVATLWAGDFNADCYIMKNANFDDSNIVYMENLMNIGNPDNFSNGVVGYFQGDFNMDSKVKFDGTNEDGNLLLNQIKNYPLNTQNLENFSHFVEQVPARK